MRVIIVLGSFMMVCMGIVAQDIPSGSWYADARSAGMGGAVMASEMQRSGIGQVCRIDTIGGSVSVNAMLPYFLGDLTIASAGGKIKWNQFAVWLYAGWSGWDEQFVSLLFEHTVGNTLFYKVGIGMYRYDAQSVAGIIEDGDYSAVWAFMPEVGLWYRPLKKLEIGLWLGNPTMTHRNDLYFASDFHLGVTYYVSDRLQGILEFEKTLQHPLSVHLGVETMIVSSKNRAWSLEGRFGVRYPYTQFSTGIGVKYRKFSLDAAAVCDWRLGWSLFVSSGMNF